MPAPALERAPVLVGAAQILQRADDSAQARAPLALMGDTVRAAFVDSGAPDLSRKTGSIRVVRGIWGYRNPGHALAAELGLGTGIVETTLTELGGNHVQMVLNHSALEIQSGRHEVIVLAGAECGRTIGRAQRAGLELPWLEDEGPARTPAPDRVFGSSRWTRHEAETARGIQRPAQFYALFEIALRHRNAEPVTGHRRRIAELWSRFSEVAAANPHAWIRRVVPAEEIAEPSATNRMISFPYTKLLTANMRVDMGAALVLCSYGAARAAGVAEHLMVFPLAGTEANDHLFVSERRDLCSSPAIRLAGRRALELAETEVAELAAIDLYSCFPSAVQVAAHELGVALEPPPTVTGGLTFGGGPLNNAVMHAIARTVEVLRKRPGSRALVSANGGLLTKHAFGVYASHPPTHPFRYADLQDEVARTPRREVVPEVRGRAQIESYTVSYEAVETERPASYNALYAGPRLPAEPMDEPAIAHLACRLPDGRRTWANTSDSEAIEVLQREDTCGHAVRLDGRGGAELL